MFPVSVSKKDDSLKSPCDNASTNLNVFDCEFDIKDSLDYSSVQ
jgi:hypothetical protein